MRFRPCIDIHNGKVKQIVGGSLRDAGGLAAENYVSEQDAAFYAHLYKESGIKGGHIILLNKAGTPEYEADVFQARLALSEYPYGLQIGGGINADNAGEFLEMGASHVIVTSYVFRDGRIDYERLDKLVEAVGREHLVLDLSCRRKKHTITGEAIRQDIEARSEESVRQDIEARSEESVRQDIEVRSEESVRHDIGAQSEESVRQDITSPYYIVTDRWQNFTDEPLSEKLIDRLSAYADEFLVHAVDVEGKASGVERELISLLAGASDIPITYAGGVGSYDDIEVIRELGGGRIDVTIGSALDLFGGKLEYDRVLSVMD